MTHLLTMDGGLGAIGSSVTTIIASYAIGYYTKSVMSTMGAVTMLHIVVPAALLAVSIGMHGFYANAAYAVINPLPVLSNVGAVGVIWYTVWIPFAAFLAAGVGRNIASLITPDDEAIIPTYAMRHVNSKNFLLLLLCITAVVLVPSIIMSLVPLAYVLLTLIPVLLMAVLVGVCGVYHAPDDDDGEEVSAAYTNIRWTHIYTSSVLPCTVMMTMAILGKFLSFVYFSSRIHYTVFMDDALAYAHCARLLQLGIVMLTVLCTWVIAIIVVTVFHKGRDARPIVTRKP